MSSGLIGYTGFVGGNLMSQYKFDYLYNSKNFREIENCELDFVVCAGISAVKWQANKEPEKDKQKINELRKSLKKAKIKHFILISTVDDPVPSNCLL